MCFFLIAMTSHKPPDPKAFSSQGFRTRRNMKTFDMIRTVNHLISSMLSPPGSSVRRSLITFQVPSIVALQAGWKREFLDGRWFYVPVAVDVRCSEAAPELPDTLLEAVTSQSLLSALPELGITWDQASWDVAASHFLRASGGLRLAGEDRPDFYHQSWNCFRAAVAAAGLGPSLIQMWHVYNCNHTSVNHALHKQKRAEGMREWIALNPPSAELSCLMASAASDASQAQASTSEEFEAMILQHVKNHPDIHKAGQAMECFRVVSLIQSTNTDSAPCHTV